MVEPSPVETSLKRLGLALTTLEAAVERRFDRDRSLSSLEDELVRAGEDRSRLAGELDQEKTRSTRLEETNHEVSRRLVSAMESIRSVLDVHGG
jgi:predicted  nucleic acid-binding Zn-ribbon protein